MDELKKCPFCGRPGERWVDSSGDSDSYVHGCRNCGEMFYGDEGDWNTRPLEDAQAAEISAWRIQKNRDEAWMKAYMDTIHELRVNLNAKQMEIDNLKSGVVPANFISGEQMEYLRKEYTDVIDRQEAEIKRKDAEIAWQDAQLKAFARMFAQLSNIMELYERLPKGDTP